MYYKPDSLWFSLRGGSLLDWERESLSCRERVPCVCVERDGVSCTERGSRSQRGRDRDSLSCRRGREGLSCRGRRGSPSPSPQGNLSLSTKETLHERPSLSTRDTLSPPCKRVYPSLSKREKLSLHLSKRETLSHYLLERVLSCSEGERVSLL